MPSERPAPTKPLPRMPVSSFKSINNDGFDSSGRWMFRKASQNSSHHQVDAILVKQASDHIPNNFSREPSEQVTRSIGRSKEPRRPQVPALNVVTSFSKPGSKMKAPLQHLAHERQELLQERRTRARRQKSSEGQKGPIGSLERPESRRSELSPSDRTLVIGISMPSSNLAIAETILKEVDQSENNLAVPQSAGHGGIPSTPEIVITPAQTRDPWPPEKEVGKLRSRQRVPSSIYSQATQFAYPVSRIQEIPPLPNYIPHSHSAIRVGNAENMVSQARVTSWATDIDEDEAPDVFAERRRHSGESQVMMLGRSSLDTVATRHRSRGWWNQIVSPFLERSDTNITRNSSNDIPRPLSVTNSASPIHNHNFRDAKLTDSPPVEKEELDVGQDVKNHAPSGAWTNTSRWEAERRSMVFPPEESLHHDEQVAADAHRGEFVLSPEFVETTGFGAASEYFEACWHDQNSPTPFFMCQNHDCSFNDKLSAALLDTENEQRAPDKAILMRSSNNGNVRAVDSFHQMPANRFSAAFSQSKGSQPRPISDATIFEEETTPEIKEAKAAPVLRAGPAMKTVPSVQDEKSRSLEGASLSHSLPPALSREAELQPDLAPAVPRQLTTFSSPNDENPAKTIEGIEAVNDTLHALEPAKPKPSRPRLQKRLNAQEDITMNSMTRETMAGQPHNIYHVNQYFGHSEYRPSPEHIGFAQFYPPPPKSQSKAEEKQYTQEGERSRGIPAKKGLAKLGCFEKAKPSDKRKKRCLYFAIATALLAMVVLTVALAMTLTRKRTDIPVQSSWLNITGYPPIPTGIATIARPDAAVANPGCVHPSTMWSCAVPKEQQSLIAPNDSDQPNFRVEIRFRNSTASSNFTSKVKRSRTALGNAVLATSMIRRRLFQKRDAFNDALYAANPSPPSQEDQAFLGNTTDKLLIPFDGESTPFYMSFLDATPPPAQISKRQSQNSTDQFPDVLGAIPSPPVNPNGTAGAANLLPFPSAQPLRLYNRGTHNEHFGFYTYFDRSIFLKSTALLNVTTSPIGEVPDDKNGGSEENAATVRCTWTQTRFLVQVWTNRGNSTTLLQGPNPTSTSSSQPVQTSNPGTSSANDFARPGSFPYPITITLDRHGGDITKKMIFCYGLDDREHVLSDEKKIQLEDRAFGGALINPALGVFGNVKVSLAEGGPGGIDGGEGGCGCEWRNWEGS